MGRKSTKEPTKKKGEQRKKTTKPLVKKKSNRTFFGYTFSFKCRFRILFDECHLMLSQYRFFNIESIY